jgi:hypothetical protein
LNVGRDPAVPVKVIGHATEAMLVLLATVALKDLGSSKIFEPNGNANTTNTDTAAD